MVVKIFDAVIYFPIIVISMIISQIYFERYLDSFTGRRLAKSAFTATIVVTYLVQELCLLQLSLLNINDAAFLMVVPVTMLFRNKQNKIWWWLLALTPLFANVCEVLMGRNNWGNWWQWVSESVVYSLVCFVLTRNRTFSLRARYTMAITSLAVIELFILSVRGQFPAATVTSATFGLFVILIFEGQRYSLEIQKEQKIKRLKNESERDDLTGLLNYRALSQEIDVLTKRKEIHNIVIGGLDIDHFKRINDTYGHFEGNEVLNFFSTVLRNRIHAAFPKHGYVYRFGGEEFSIVVSNHSVAEVYAVLQSVEEFFNQQPITTKEGTKISISFSASLTNHLSGELLDTTLKRADKMLYSVKNNGRGWIITDHHHRTKKTDFPRAVMGSELGE